MKHLVVALLLVFSLNFDLRAEQKIVEVTSLKGIFTSENIGSIATANLSGRSASLRSDWFQVVYTRADNPANLEGHTGATQFNFGLTSASTLSDAEKGIFAEFKDCLNTATIAGSRKHIQELGPSDGLPIGNSRVNSKFTVTILINFKQKVSMDVKSVRTAVPLNNVSSLSCTFHNH